eukprot:3316712-Pleurochrysis_carterae.AAC.1
MTACACDNYVYRRVSEPRRRRACRKKTITFGQSFIDKKRARSYDNRPWDNQQWADTKQPQTNAKTSTGNSELKRLISSASMRLDHHAGRPC